MARRQGQGQGQGEIRTLGSGQSGSWAGIVKIVVWERPVGNRGMTRMPSRPCLSLPPGAGAGPEIIRSQDPIKGTYEPVWIAMGELPRRDVRPNPLARLVRIWQLSGWPAKPIRIRDRR